MGAFGRTCWVRAGALLCTLFLASGCGLIGGDNTASTQQAVEEDRGESFFDLFLDRDDANVTVAVNKYLWNASLEVLNFLPIQSADSFTGVIATGFGTPPGGSRAYRATILVRDPALDARSLNISLATRSGPASVETVRAVEDAILTRARQLRQRDLDL